MVAQFVERQGLNMAKDIRNNFDKMVEDDGSTKSKIKKGALTAYKTVLTVPSVAGGAAVGTALSPLSDMPGPVDSALGGAKLAYHGLWGNEKDSENDVADMKAAKQRSDSIERKPNKGENTNPAGDTYKKGGSAHSRADGIASKGHTRGKYL